MQAAELYAQGQRHTSGAPHFTVAVLMVLLLEKKEDNAVKKQVCCTLCNTANQLSIDTEQSNGLVVYVSQLEP